MGKINILQISDLHRGRANQVRNPALIDSIITDLKYWIHEVETYISQYIKMYSLKTGKQVLLRLHFYPLFLSMVDITLFLAISYHIYFSSPRNGIFRS